MSNVRKDTVERNLCVSCGICKAVCPHDAIEYKREEGIYVPQINDKCTKCGLCVKVCPGVISDYPALYEAAKETVPDNILTGSAMKCYVAKTRDNAVLANATSGGIVTALISECLEKGYYDSAFCVDSYSYDEQVTTSKYTAGMDLSKTQKSRYIPVSHEKLIDHMRENRNEKIIITATSCAMQGILKAIDLYKLDRKQYLLLGLFCDKVLSYHVQDYFRNKMKSGIKEFYFRDKKAGGWPGNISIILQSGERIELPARERMKLKKFLQLERCLYCIDKLNQLSDIAIGDNYTEINKTTDGSSSVIVRTESGENIWNSCEHLFDSKEIALDDIINSQHIENRNDNLIMAEQYSKTLGYSINVFEGSSADCSKQREEADRLYRERLENIQLGRQYLEKPEQLYKVLCKQEKERQRADNIIKLRTVLGKIKRKIAFHIGG